MWCWHRIRESETGLCPACRTPYGEDPHQFSAVDVEEVLKANKEREAAAKRERHHQQPSNKDGEVIQSIGSDLSNALVPDVPKDRSQLANMRVIRRNLIYAVGLPPAIAVEEILRKPEYFGQYGKIAKIVVNRTNAASTTPAEARRANASAYVTFQHKEDTLACILALDGFYLENRNIRASYGTSKYCSAFIKNVRCNNPECTYLHEMGANEDTFSKQEIQAGYVTSGRDVLARQQQILAEQLRLQQIAAGGTGSATQSLPRKRVGGGGPSGTGKPCSNPIFPPPEYDEAVKTTPPVPPPPAAITRATTLPTAQSTVAVSSPPGPLPATAIRAESIGPGSKALPVTIASTQGIANRKPQVGGLPGTTTAASVVAAGRKEVADVPTHNVTLTTLTPLKRATANKLGSTSTKATTDTRSASSSPSRSAGEDEKVLGQSNARNGKLPEAKDDRIVGQPVGLMGSIYLSNQHFNDPHASIGGDIIGLGVSSSLTGLGALGSHLDPVVGRPVPQGSGMGAGSLGGIPIQLGDSRSAPKPSSLSSTLGGEIFNGPLSNDYQHKAVIGSSNDKWNGSNRIEGSNINPIASSLGSNDNLWMGSSSNSGVIGGQRINGNLSGGNSTSALASILGINLPTGSGSLHESSTIWTSGMQHSAGPSPISTLNGTSINAHTGPVNTKVIGGSASVSNSLNNNNGTSIGGVPIGGFNGGYHSHGAIGGGSKTSDVALLQSLLPGVLITADSNNPMIGFNNNNSDWNLAPSLTQQRFGAANGAIGGDPIHSGINWSGSATSIQGHRGTSIGAVGQQANLQNNRQQGPGIW